MPGEHTQWFQETSTFPAGTGARAAGDPLPGRGTLPGAGPSPAGPGAADTGTPRVGRAVPAGPEDTVALRRIPRQPGPADLRRSPAARPAPDARPVGRTDAAPDPGHTAVRTPQGAPHTSWSAPETSAGDPTHDPHEVTVQMDAVQLGGIRLSPAAGTPRPAGRDDGPVFVDESGRRSRRSAASACSSASPAPSTPS
ncbi:hypothetical protein [Streptomyces bungoensis]|uniref:hypothetical protein n=1 Tax=Streptomyces bungoensis TaxID=285568 RepID=UPI00340888F2